MDFTFTYEVKTNNTDVIVAEVSFKETLTTEQTQRLIESYKKGKYMFLNEDEEISDIYEFIHDIAIESEEQQEYGELLGTKIDVEYFKYPVELKEM